MKLLVTGGCGFLGSHFIRTWLKRHPDDDVLNVDCLTYAGSLDNLEDAADHPHYRHIKIDIADPSTAIRLAAEPFDLLIHFAAETHVDRSLEDAGRFVRTNVLGTQALLAAASQRTTNTSESPSVIIISTDEVYGPTPEGEAFDEQQPLNPTSPYAASKAAADLMARSYARSYGIDVTVIRSVNIYGPRQYPEKLTPLFVTRALAGEKLPLYGDGEQRRCWLYVDDYVDGLIRIAENPEIRRQQSIWHLGSNHERINRDVAQMLCEFCAADPGLIAGVPDRPGHDRRYALSFGATTKHTGWQPQIDLNTGLKRTVEWIKANLEWCRERARWKPSFLSEY
jgi:dTDP-glucose 4,6-dehydratase